MLSSETVSSSSEVREESSSLERRLSNTTVDINLKLTENSLEMVDSTTTRTSTTTTTAIPGIIKNGKAEEPLTECFKSEIKSVDDDKSMISQIKQKVKAEIEKSDSKPKLDEKLISQSDESIQSLREEIDQLLAPIISNQVHMTSH